MTGNFDALKGLELVVEQLNDHLEGKNLKSLDRAQTKALQELMGVTAIAQQLSRIATALETIAEHSAEHTLRERKRG